jgi:two-component system, cell cycle response regulator DivK
MRSRKLKAARRHSLRSQPIMDGYTATRQIKADPALRSIKIIAVTSYALSGEEKKAREAGCDDYVPKPFSPRQLLAKIRQYLS